MVGYLGPEQAYISPNLKSANLAPGTMAMGIAKDLSCGRIVESTTNSPFISSPLGFVLKQDSSLRCIHHLSFPIGTSVNDGIPIDASHLHYTTIIQLFALIVRAGRHSIIIKRDIKDAFRNIPLAPHIRWLLGFSWDNKYYTEACLPFGLRTAPFIFNLFAEGFHWMLQSYLGWELLEHYLDDFIHIVPASMASPTALADKAFDYIMLTNFLGVPRNDKKDRTGLVVEVLGYEINTIHMTVYLPQVKLDRAINATDTALHQKSLSKGEAESLAGFLSFCAPVVQLGWVFCRRLWSFVASFGKLSKFMRIRMPLLLIQDIIWWNTLLPRFNGVLILDEIVRLNIHLYTDASGVGMGGFFFTSDTLVSWQEAIPLIMKEHSFQTRLQQTHIPLIMKEHSCQTHLQQMHIPSKQESHATDSLTSILLDYQEEFSTQTDTHWLSTLAFDINIFEMEAISQAFKLFSYQWRGHRVFVHTDNSTACIGLNKHTLSSPANAPLRNTLLCAAGSDIVIVPRWISGESNGLADALSRFDIEKVANLCPHW
jgi:hypothetical protein